VGAFVRRQTPLAQLQLHSAAVARVRLPLEVAGGVHRLQVIEHRAERHAEKVRHLGSCQRRHLEEEAVDGVLVRPHPRRRHRVAQQAPHPLAGDEEVEKQRDVSAQAFRRTLIDLPRIRGKYHGSVVVSSGRALGNRDLHRAGRSRLWDLE
jgi:hypothetical protein